MPRLRYLGSLFAIAALVGCDRQVETDFQGDSLLRIKGSVAIPLGLEGRDLLPAIAFQAASAHARECDGGRRFDQLRIMDVGIDGDFPSRFTLDVFDPPPPEALLRHGSDEPSFAVGYVTAMPAVHPDAVLMRPNDQETYDEWGDIDQAECESTTTPGGGLCMVLHACTLDKKRCLHRTLHCPPSEHQILLSFSDCSVEKKRGDESLAAAGYSVNYRVVYFSEAVAAGSELAATWSAGKAIAAGYHLYHWTPVASTEMDTAQCIYDATTQATDRYNMKHGTSVSIVDFIPSAKPSFDMREEWSCYVSQGVVESGCQDSSFDVKEVSGRPISIELGTLDANSNW